MAKRQIPKALFEPFEHVEVANLLDNEALITMIKRETPLAIEEAFKQRKTFATLFEIGGTDFFLDLPKQSWISALESCIAFKLEEEEFEDCIAIKNLIEQIRKGNKIIPKKSINKKEDGTGIDGHSISN